MQERYLSTRERVPERTTVFLENDDDKWRVGAWTSSTGVCKMARGREGAQTAVRWKKKGLLAAMAIEETSFESLDMRAAEVLDRSLQTLESATSLISYALAMKMNYRRWEGKGDCWEVEKSQKQEVERSRDWDPSECLHSCRREVGRTTADCHGCEYDRAKVVKEMTINNGEYGLKLCTVVSKTLEDAIDKMLVKDSNVLNVKENAFEEDRLDYSRAKLWNEIIKESTMDSNQVLSRPTPAVSSTLLSNESVGGGSGCFRAAANLESFPDDTMKRADGDGGASSEKKRDAASGGAATLDRITQTVLTGLSYCKKPPPKVMESRALRLKTRPKGELQRKIISVSTQREKQRSLKNSHGEKDPVRLEQRKLVLPGKPPKGKGLSAALSIMRSFCHGAGEGGVVDAQARPLLVIAGKCVFRTIAPLDTPRLCTALKKRQSHVQRDSNTNEGSLSSPRPADVPTEDAWKASSDFQSASKPMVASVTSVDGPSRTLPRQNKCQAISSSILHWPAVVTGLDNWISHIVNEWLDKDEHLAADTSSSLTHPSVTIASPVLSSTFGVCSEEEFGVFRAPPVSNIKEPTNVVEEQGKLVSAPSKKLTKLDTKISQAQTLHDLSQILEPIYQASMSSVQGSKVAGEMKISLMSIIQEFGRDDVVQEFQRQIHDLERENEDLKSSLCKQEHFDIIRSLKALQQ